HQGYGDMKLLLIAALTAACLLGQTVLEQADEAFRQGNFDRAATLARLAVAQNSQTPPGPMIPGVLPPPKNPSVSRPRPFETVVRLEPSNPYGYFYLGQAKLFQQQWEKAIAYLSKARDLQYPERERLAIELATAQNEAGHPQAALASLEGIGAPDDRRLA